jgi:hypothetical protein
MDFDEIVVFPGVRVRVRVRVIVKMSVQYSTVQYSTYQYLHFHAWCGLSLVSLNFVAWQIQIEGKL